MQGDDAPAENGHKSMSALEKILSYLAMVPVVVKKTPSYFEQCLVNVKENPPDFEKLPVVVKKIQPYFDKLSVVAKKIQPHLARAIIAFKEIPLHLRGPIVAAAILLLGVAGCTVLVKTKPDIPAQPSLPNLSIVEAVIVDIKTEQPFHQAFGTVEASRTADLRFNINGEVGSVLSDMRNGALVKAGQDLARLDDEILRLNKQDIEIQIAAETDNLRELENQLDLQQRQFDRVREMAAAAVASERRLDEAKLSLSIASNAVRQSRSRLDQAKIKLKQIDRNLNDSLLKAPFDGVLSDVGIGEGRVVTSQNVLGMLTDLSSLEVSFIVPAEIYAESDKLIGQTITVTWKSGGRDVKTAPAEIARAEGLIKANEGGGRIYATLPAADSGQHAAIPPGAFVEITYPSTILEDIIILPDTALYDNDNVFVVEGGVAKERTVTIISKSDGLIYVRGDLVKGDQVITTRLPGLGEGVRVRVINS
jgi:RND family efflux transporter MFP subunit